MLGYSSDSTSYTFRLPKFVDLTVQQQAALNDSRSIALSGGPGTGKSVVSLWRHIRNCDQGKKSLLLTYTKTLEGYFSASAKTESPNAANHIGRTFLWLKNPSEYSEIIIDEAQDVPENNYYTLKKYAKSVAYGADDRQILYPKDSTTEAALKSIFNPSHVYELKSNFRNTSQILAFAQTLFSFVINKESLRSGPLPVIVTKDDVAVEVVNIVKSFSRPGQNTAVLVLTQREVDIYYNLLKNTGINCSKFKTEDGIFPQIENVHITTFKSSKGLEFDTVIIPDFHNMENNIKSPTFFIANESDYYVAITRAKTNLFLVCNRVPSFLIKSEKQIKTYELSK